MQVGNQLTGGRSFCEVHVLNVPRLPRLCERCLKHFETTVADCEKWLQLSRVSIQKKTHPTIQHSYASHEFSKQQKITEKEVIGHGSAQETTVVDLCRRPGGTLHKMPPGTGDHWGPGRMGMSPCGWDFGGSSMLAELLVLFVSCLCLLLVVVAG